MDNSNGSNSKTNFFEMKQKITLFTFLIFSVNVFATEQAPDLLIIGNKTISLDEFPLEQLEMKYRPFSFGAQENVYASSGCWRGYRAVWKIIDNKLFLEKIIQCHNQKEENIVDFFEKNDIKYQEIDGLIFANWYTENLYKNTSKSNKKEKYLNNGWDKLIKSKKRIILQIENGLVTINKLK